MSKYHFLYGTKVETKDFDNDAAAIEAAKSDKNVLRVQSDKTLKHIVENTELIASLKKAAAAVIMAALILFGFSTQAATSAVLTGIAPVINSNSGTTNSTSLATNGLYTATIAQSTTETNLVQITPNNAVLQGKPISIEIVGANTAANTNSVVVVISSSTGPITPSATWGTSTNAMAGSVIPRSVYTTITFPLNGTANTLAKTNVVFSINSTPQYGGGTELFIESIGQTGTGTGALTNYSVSVGQAN